MSYHILARTANQAGELLNMPQKVRLFQNGRSQAVRLPAAYRFDCEEVYIRRDPETGDVILSRRPDNWSEFFALLNSVDVPDDFLDQQERESHSSARDPFDDWQE